MKEILKYLLKIQSIILTILLICILLGPWRGAVTSALLGGVLCLLTTVQALLIFWRLPEVLPAQRFLQAIRQAEIRKWLMVAVLGAVFVQYGQPLAVFMGFATTYTAAYFWAILKK